MAKGDINKLNAKRTRSERQKAASKAGKASGAKRKEFASFRECFKENMDDAKRQEMFDMLYGRAKRGNLKAFEILRDTMGEKNEAEDNTALERLDSILEGVIANAKRLDAEHETE